MDYQQKTKILGIDHIWEIINGSLEKLKHIEPNQVGQVVTTEDGEIVSEITPIIMIINQNSSNRAEKLKIISSIGGDFDKKINYYGNNKSANDILNQIASIN
tara:strand:- start:373 stop:678 length:306 start_codon:yes stop_codon:yes gene_type:complete